MKKYEEVFTLAKALGYDGFAIYSFTQNAAFNHNSRNILMECVLIQRWLMDQEIYLQPHLIDQFGDKSRWGYELTYYNSKEWINTDEPLVKSSYEEALLYGIGHCLDILQKKI